MALAASVTLTLRFKLALGFALVAAVPLVAMQQAASGLVRRQFASSTAAEFAASRSLVEGHFLRAGAEIVAEVEAIATWSGDSESSFRLREAFLDYAYATADAGPAQRRVIDALGAAAVSAGLPLLSLHAEDGTVVASSQEPLLLFNTPDDRVLGLGRDHPGRPVLTRQQGIDIRGLALKVVVPIDASPGGYWLSGGVLVDDDFLASLPVSDALAFLVVADDGVSAAPTRAGREATAVVAVGAGDAALERLEQAGWHVAELSLQGIATREPAVLLLATSRAPMEAFVNKLNAVSVSLLVLGLLVAWLLAYLISRRWTDPIDQLVAGFEQVARGDLTTRVAIERDDELGRLGHEFNAMTHDLAESRDRLLRAERVAAWQEIARRLAHEIKNPLSPIALSMENLRRAHEVGRPDFPALLVESTTTVLEEVDRLRRIVQSFSDFARLPRARLEEESLHEVVRGVLALYASQGDRYRFTTDFEPGDDRFEFDLDQLNRLLVNLVKNAIEAMPDGGEVRIETRRLAVEERFRIRVSDTGPGVRAEVADELFRPYRTTKLGGTGLGLAIVHRIASEHGGDVRLVNPGAPGACFEVVLPLHPVPQEPHE